MNDLDLVLVDDVQLIMDLLSDNDHGSRVTRVLDEESGDELPLVMFDVTGSDNPAIVNGPGLWDVDLTVWVWAETDADLWRVAQSVHRQIKGWDFPSAGVVPGVAGVERVETAAKFADVNNVEVPSRLLRQTIAQYTLLLRVTN